MHIYLHREFAGLTEEPSFRRQAIDRDQFANHDFITLCEILSDSKNTQCGEVCICRGAILKLIRPIAASFPFERWKDGGLFGRKICSRRKLVFCTN